MELKNDLEIQAVTVGTAHLLNNQVSLADYDTHWPHMFAEQEQKIRQALSSKVILLEHVGSTSVPGLAAKPIIDVVLAVPKSADETAYVPQLAIAGYNLKIREPDWFEHRVLKPEDQTVNLHVFTFGCTEIQRMIAFRDWLRNHSEDKQLYESTKRSLAQKTWKYMQHYADAKSEVISSIMSRAYSED